MSIFYCEFCDALVDSDFVEATEHTNHTMICQKHIDNDELSVPDIMARMDSDIERLLKNKFGVDVESDDEN